MANERPPMRMMGRGGPPPHERMLMAEKPKNTKGTLKRLVCYIGKNSVSTIHSMPISNSYRRI